MSPTDDLWKWSDELAREPSSLVFLRLGEALRRQGELALALKIALRGLERHPNHVDAHALVARITADRGAILRVGAPAEAVRDAPLPVSPDPRSATGSPFSTSDGAQALLVDAQGHVLAGVYRDAEGNDIGQELAAQLSGISDEALRATRHLDLGGWRSIIIETDCAVIAMAPIGESAVTVVTASRSMPLGMLRRVLSRCTDRAAEWVGTAP